jgi:hypothetical protein
MYRYRDFAISAVVSAICSALVILASGSGVL